MRKWHRWTSVVFGIFLFWIAITGFLSQVVPLTLGRPPQAQAVAPAGFVCPETMICRPKPTSGQSFVSTLHRLHSGESFGTPGTTLFTLAGLALIFFAGSGLWLYFQMWSNRRKRRLKPGWFWK